jgi:hypothetical protein
MDFTALGTGGSWSEAPKYTGNLFISGLYLRHRAQENNECSAWDQELMTCYLSLGVADTVVDDVEWRRSDLRDLRGQR